MTSEDIKQEVKRRFKRTQQITIVKNEDERKIDNKIQTTIVDFFPNFVLTRRHGFYEGYTYWDILHMAKVIQPKIPNRIKKRRKAG